jgi:hypothetical protein
MNSSAICPQAGSRFHHHLQSSPRRMRFPAVGSRPLRSQNQTVSVGRPFSSITQLSPAQPGTAFVRDSGGCEPFGKIGRAGSPLPAAHGAKRAVPMRLSDGAHGVTRPTLNASQKYNPALAPRRRCSGTRFLVSGNGSLSSRDRSGSSRSRPLSSRDHSGSSRSRSGSSRSRSGSSRSRSGSSRSHPLGSRDRCGSLGNDCQNPQFASRLPVNNIKNNDLQC